MKTKGLLIGLTGQTGAGKTTVSGYFVRLGHKVIDADAAARHVVAKGSPCILELAETFGPEIILPGGTLNRRKMGDIVFGDSEKRQTFNTIIFPYIQEEILGQVERMQADGVPVIFLDAPTLFESGLHQSCDKIISVIAARGIRLERIISRDKLSEHQAQNRINSQHGDDFYTSRSDFIITNSGDLTDLRERIDALITEIKPGVMEGEQ